MAITSLVIAVPRRMRILDGHIDGSNWGQIWSHEHAASWHVQIAFHDLMNCYFRFLTPEGADKSGIFEIRLIAQSCHPWLCGSVVWHRDAVAYPRAMLAPARAIPLPKPAKGPAWTRYAGDDGATQYSTLADITSANVNNLKVAWTFRTGDMDIRKGDPDLRGFANTPIMAGGSLILCTPIRPDMTACSRLGRSSNASAGSSKV